MLITYPDTPQAAYFGRNIHKDMTVLVEYRISHAEYINQNVKRCLPAVQQACNRIQHRHENQMGKLRLACLGWS